MKRQYTVYLVRHAQTDENKRGAYIGALSDVALSEKGTEQIMAAKEEYTELMGYPKTVYSSPMVRCTDTALGLWPDCNVKIVDNLKEMNFGKFEGMTYRELNGNPEYQRWIDSGGKTAFPGGEYRDGFIVRTMSAFRQVLRDYSDNEGTYIEINSETVKNHNEIVIVCHGGTIMAVMSSIFSGDYYDYQVNNLCGYKLEVEQDGKNIYGKSYSCITAGAHT